MRRVIVLAGLGVALLLGVVTVARFRQPAAAPAFSANVVDFLSGDSGLAGFARVTAPRPLVFPDDAGPHPAYQTEWWYYTGNLADEAGRRYGFQLTFFRRALTPSPAARSSAWGASQVYLAHFTVTDVAGGTFHSAERLARGAAGLAGAQADPFRVWVEDWSSSGVGTEPGRVRLVAADGPVGLDLLLTPAKPAARHGQDGFSPKGSEPGNASYYYSYTDLGASGTLTTATGAHRVEGKAWMDHEWSTSALAEGQVGWDWFALQLADGRELMLYQIREAAGGTAPASSGSLVAPDGSVTPLDAAAFELLATATWTSPRTGGVYPSGWRVRVPGAELDLRVTPLAKDQELSTGLRYWEGAVQVSGSSGERPASGYGYVELTGYAEAEQGGALPGLP